jgi:hypothetical protein
MKDNFFLLDVMGTDNSHLISEYLKTSMESIDMTPSYYKLHNFNLHQYKRRFAIIDHRIANMDLWNSEEYWRELMVRINFLRDNDFVLILGQQWEFIENMRSFTVQKRYLDVLREVKHFIWNGGTDWFWFYLNHTHKDKQFNFNHEIKFKDFLYLNKRSRPHREKLFTELYSNNILKNSVFSYIDNPFNIYLDKKYEIYDQSKAVVDLPEYLGIKSKLKYGLDHDINEICYNDTVASIVSESTVSKDNLFFSEKIWKPIIAKHIFLVHGQSFTLKTLKDIGFKTFDIFFDEGYDTELDDNKKIQKIFSSCKQILQLDYDQLYKKTTDIRNHNYELFFNQKKIQEVIKNKLLQFFKFFDSGQVSSRES